MGKQERIYPTLLQRASKTVVPVNSGKGNSLTSQA